MRRVWKAAKTFGIYSKEAGVLYVPLRSNAFCHETMLLGAYQKFDAQKSYRTHPE